MTTVSRFDEVTPVVDGIRGRSLWADAWKRLRSNKAAVAGTIVLAVIAVASILGPLLSPHDVGQVYRSHIKVPASTGAYPRAAEIPEILRKALRRSRADITNLEIEGDEVALVLSSDTKIDPRITRSLERNADFANVRIVEASDDGRTLESVRRLYVGLQSFRSMSRMDASLMKASALRLRFSQSLASRRQRLSQAMVRSTTQRLGWTTKPFTRSDRLTISVSRSGRMPARAR